MIEALSQQLLNQFAKNLTALIEADAAHAATVATQNTASEAAAPNSPAEPDAPRPASQARRPPPAPAPVAPLDAGALMRKAMWQSIRNYFARLFGRKQPH
jgi:hypothetical protein